MARPKGLPKTGGKKKGYKFPATLAREAAERIYRAKIAAKLEPLIDAQIEVAQGVSHMQARGKDGKWIEVTDPAIMARCLNSGEAFYRITANNPDVRALKDIFDRYLGLPQQSVAVTGANGDPLVVHWKG